MDPRFSVGTPFRSTANGSWDSGEGVPSARRFLCLIPDGDELLECTDRELSEVHDPEPFGGDDSRREVFEKELLDVSGNLLCGRCEGTECCDWLILVV